ncbi:MAG: response regulator [Desulfobacteraceae bacterium]|nr:MAG: response regulator [Desulfobacteraceae bacterium]
MKILVGYNGGEVGRKALSAARDYAKLHQASLVYVLTSMEGGASEKQADIIKAQEGLTFARSFIEDAGITCDAQESVRGLSPGEDLVMFAQENDVDHIFLGLKKKSRAQKLILGSTSRHVILKASCPVTTVKFDLETLSDHEILKDRRILIVDDEPDIVETIEEILDMCTLDTAGDFDTAKNLLDEKTYDAAVLDIMGVQGYDILDITTRKEIPSLMLTAHALTPDNLKVSLEKGADAYVPKDELANIDEHMADVIKTRIAGKTGYGAWFSNLRPFFDKTFGQGWRDKDRSFWNSFDDKYGGG